MLCCLAITNGPMGLAAASNGLIVVIVYTNIAQSINPEGFVVNLITLHADCLKK